MMINLNVVFPCFTLGQSYYSYRRECENMSVVTSTWIMVVDQTEGEPWERDIPSPVLTENLTEKIFPSFPWYKIFLTDIYLFQCLRKSSFLSPSEYRWAPKNNVPETLNSERLGHKTSDDDA